VNQDWHKIVEAAVDRNPVTATFVRIGDPDIEASLAVTPMQFIEQVGDTSGNVVQQRRKWMVPARRLASLDYPLPIIPGDLIRVPMLGVEARIGIVGPGLAGGEVVRWDITEEGVT
jgi:hypothetical protein